MNSAVNQSQISGCDLQTENDVILPNNRQSATGKAAYNALVLDARTRQSLVTVRSLGSRGLQVTALETREWLPAPALSSRWCQHKIICPAHEGTKEYLTYLEDALDFTGAQVVIPASDSTIALIRQFRERLEQRVHVALAKEPALAIAVNKEQTLEVAKKLELAVPRGVTVGNVSEVRAALREIGLPLVVKPVESWMQDQNKQETGIRVESRLVTTSDEALRAVEELTNLGGPTLFQQFIPGKHETMNFLYAHGQMYARFAHWIKRTNPPLGGTDVLRQSIAIPSDIGEQAERLVREIELEGYSQVEFRRDSSGRPYLMEINPRLTAGIELAVHAGVDFPYLLYQWANGDPIDVVKDYRVGIWMRHLGGDLATTIAAIVQRGRPGVTPPAQAILDFCASFFISMRYDYIDWKDPLPILSAIMAFPRDLLQIRGKELKKDKYYIMPSLEEILVDK